MNEEEEFLPGGFAELLRQAQEMQDQLAQVQGTAAEEVVEGHAGGGGVSVTVNGAMEFLAVHIDPEAVDPRDVGMLEDLVLAALRDAVDKVRAFAFGSAGGLGDLGDLMGPLGEMLQGLMGGGTLELEEGEPEDGADPA
ncbi:MAG TPA: YbaB/EbfC family nucleoid-associated protein [Acidimicrobiales bacterium]|nr:YbaB/EbfC family nucleoid-associated protein [Acidimicrobiales bacterium]